MTTMRAAWCARYGGPEVVGIRDVPAPAPGPGEILIRVRSTTVSSGDARVRAARFPSGLALPARLALGLTGPRQPILGTELAGVVEAVGPRVTRWRVGDEVVAMTGMRFGGHAELKVIGESAAVVAKPADWSFEEAATLSFGGTTALHFLRDAARLAAGERVLVNGASGAVGLAAVQIARHLGAQVTAVCSAGNAALLRGLGAADVIDYRTQDFARPGRQWDVIVDAVGTAPYRRAVAVLPPGGRLVQVVAGLGAMVAGPFRSLVSGRKIISGTAPERAEDLAHLATLVQSGALRPVIDSRYPLDRIEQAHARVDTGRKVGSVVVTVS